MHKSNLNSSIIKIWPEDSVNNPGEGFKIVQIEYAYDDKYIVEFIEPKD